MKYGVQLYSLRKYLSDESGYDSVFAQIKEMGAQTVQLSGGKPIAPKTLNELLKKYELPICATHSAFSRIENELDKLAEEHLEYGCKVIGIGMMPKKFRTGKMDDIKRFTDFLNDCAEKLAKYQMNVAYHNHWFEFDKIGNEVIYDYLIENTVFDVQFIPDTFWIKVGGYEPSYYLQVLEGRVSVLHLKDYKKTLGIPVFRAIGKGELDFSDILGVAESTGIENAVVELDMSPNPIKSMRYSLNTLKGLNADK